MKFDFLLSYRAFLISTVARRPGVRKPGRSRPRTPLSDNTGSNPQRDTIELAKFKCVISLPADVTVVRGADP